MGTFSSEVLDWILGCAVLPGLCDGVTEVSGYLGLEAKIDLVVHAGQVKGETPSGTET